MKIETKFEVSESVWLFDLINKIEYEDEVKKIYPKAKVLDSIEPNMTQQRADELKISIQIKLLEEQYQIAMDGKPVGEPYPMPPGMLAEIMWGKSTTKLEENGTK